MLTVACEREFSMGKHNCCVPNCVNSWRNSPGVKYHHSLPKDKVVCKEYKRLIRNDNLKEFSANTRICGNHFPGRERMSRTQLPSIDLPAKRKNMSVDFEAVGNTSWVFSATETEQAEEIQKLQNDGLKMQEEIDRLKKEVNNLKQGEEIQKLQNDRLKMQEEIDRLKKEDNKLKFTLEKEPQFNTDEFKDNDADIAFYTGFQNYDTTILCFNVLKEKRANLSYGNHQRVNFEPKTKSDVKRKLSLWQLGVHPSPT